MNFKKNLAKFWKFLKEDSWQSWLVSLIPAFIIIKFIFFPSLSFIMGTSLPLVVVESCSMYHNSNFDSWWDANGPWYESKGITKDEFRDFPIKNGLNKGDVVIIGGRGEYKTGDIIVFESNLKFPLIHRLVSEKPFSTKGDNNARQIDMEINIPEETIIGKSLAKIPYIGWIKLIFFEAFKSPEQRGFC